MNWLEFNDIHVATQLHIADQHTIYFYTKDKAYYWNSHRNSLFAEYGYVERTRNDLKFQNSLPWYKKDTRYVVLK